MSFTQSPTIQWRGKLAQLVAQVQNHKPKHGECSGRIRCLCGASFQFTVQANGLSRGQCSAGCGARWLM